MDRIAKTYLGLAVTLLAIFIAVPSPGLGQAQKDHDCTGTSACKGLCALPGGGSPCVTCVDCPDFMGKADCCLLDCTGSWGVCLTAAGSDFNTKMPCPGTCRESQAACQWDTKVCP